MRDQRASPVRTAAQVRLSSYRSCFAQPRFTSDLRTNSPPPRGALEVDNRLSPE